MSQSDIYERFRETKKQNFTVFIMCFHLNLMSTRMSVPWSFLRWKRGEPRKLFLMELRRVLQGMPPMEGLGGGVGVGVPAGLSLGVCTGVPFGVGRGLPRGEG